MFCSTTINVFLKFFDKSNKVFPINETMDGCIPSAGSSKIIISGSKINALAIASCCCCPPLNDDPLANLFSFKIGNKV